MRLLAFFSGAIFPAADIARFLGRRRVMIRWLLEMVRETFFWRGGRQAVSLKLSPCHSPGSARASPPPTSALSPQQAPWDRCHGKEEERQQGTDARGDMGRLGARAVLGRSGRRIQGTAHLVALPYHSRDPYVSRFYSSTIASTQREKMSRMF